MVWHSFNLDIRSTWINFRLTSTELMLACGFSIEMLNKRTNEQINAHFKNRNCQMVAIENNETHLNFLNWIKSCLLNICDSSELWKKPKKENRQKIPKGRYCFSWDQTNYRYYCQDEYERQRTARPNVFFNFFNSYVLSHV